MSDRADIEADIIEMLDGLDQAGQSREGSRLIGFLAGQMASRFSRASVADLMETLGAHIRSGSMGKLQ
jgi:hypothetical protein